MAEKPAARVYLADREDPVAGLSHSPSLPLASHSRAHVEQVTISKETAARTHALLWARSLATLRAEEQAISTCVELAQDEYIAALERLAKCHLTSVAQSPQPDHDESVTQVHVEGHDEIVRALDETTLESFDMEF